MNKHSYHPGTFLQDYIDDQHITVEEFAKRINLPLQKVQSLLAGKTSVDNEIAIHLSQYLHTSTQLWLNLQEKSCNN